jgi:hypothetical protein
MGKIESLNKGGTKLAGVMLACFHGERQKPAE